MPRKPKSKIGAVAWTDLTVKPAAKVRDFYTAVVGRKATEVDMGGYADYGMNQPADGQMVGGICPARGENAGVPPQWLISINVANLQASLAECRKLGGRVICPRARCRVAAWR